MEKLRYMFPEEILRHTECEWPQALRDRGFWTEAYRFCEFVDAGGEERACAQSDENLA